MLITCVVINSFQFPGKHVSHDRKTTTINKNYYICTPVTIYNNKGEGGWTPTQKLSLLQLVETKKRFFKEIMREQLPQIKISDEGFGAEMTSGYPNN